MGKALKERQSVCWKRTPGARHLPLLQGSVAFLHSRGAPLRSSPRLEILRALRASDADHRSPVAAE
jgi:hypothetical protein